MSMIEVEVGHLHVPYPVQVASKITGHVILYGYSIKEATGLASAELDIFDGADTTSGVFLPITLSAGQSTEDWFGPQGIRFRRGLVPNVAVGAIVGCMFVHLMDG